LTLRTKILSGYIVVVVMAVLYVIAMGDHVCSMAFGKKFLSYREMQVGVEGTGTLFLALGVIYALLSIGLALLLYRVTSALNRVTYMAKTISMEDLSGRLPLGKEDDELDELARSFNKMTERFEENMRTLRESEQKYLTVVENARDGVVILQDDRLVFCNTAFSDITGYSIEELLTINTHYAILKPELVDRAKKRVRNVLMGLQEPKIGEIQIVCKDGSILSMEVNSGVIEYEKRKAILAIMRDLTERKDYQEKLRRLSTQVIATQEEERKRIARELHDDIGQTLTAIDLNMELLDKYREVPAYWDNFARICEDIRKLAVKGVDDIHRICLNLRPHLLDNFGLISALRWFMEDFHERTGIGVSLQVEDESLCFHPTLEILIYRVAQEALTNVVKHAEAKSVRLALRSSPEGTELVIEDDGKGFIVEDMIRIKNSGRGLGVFGMKERVSAFGGILTITSRNGKGTRVAALFPSLFGILTHERAIG